MNKRPAISRKFLLEYQQWMEETLWDLIIIFQTVVILYLSHQWNILLCYLFSIVYFFLPLTFPYFNKVPFLQTKWYCFTIIIIKWKIKMWKWKWKYKYKNCLGIISWGSYILIFLSLVGNTHGELFKNALEG